MNTAFLKVTGILIGVTALSPAPCVAESIAGAPKRPNVLVILTDQQHAGMMSCTGNKWLKTPNMDRLAAEGVRFEKAYASNPVCVPSRFAMFTGTMPSAIGGDSNAIMGKQVPSSILDNAMGVCFRRAGYKTVYGGKTHLPGLSKPGGSMEPYGFEFLAPRNNEGREELVDACVGFLQQRQDKPFLLVASFINPHDICYMAIQAEKRKGNETEPRLKPGAGKGGAQDCLQTALKRPEGLSEAEFFDTQCPPLPSNFEIQKEEPDGLTALDFRSFRAYVRQYWTEKDWRLHRWAYARLTERVDGQIGQVLEALKKSGLAENTVVVFVSDHGDMDSAHRLEHKSMPYEEAMHVPFIVSGKGVSRPGAIDREHLVSTGLDLIPTVCDFAGIPIPSALKGKSVRKLVAGEAPADWRKTLVIENENSLILHAGDKKYAVMAKGEKREQFMDLKKDPGEMKNVAYKPEYKAQVAEARQALKTWYAEHGLKLDPIYVIE